MEKILVTSKDLFAVLDPLKAQDPQVPAVEPSRFGSTQFGFEGIEPCDLADEVHRPAVLEVDDRICGNDGPGLSGDILHVHVLARRKIDPDIDIQGAAHHPLSDGCRHADDQVADTLCFKGFQ